MAPTYSKRGRVLKQETGTNDGTWGEEEKVGTTDRQDDMWGTTEVVVDAPVTLTAAEGLADQAREFVLIFTGAGGFPVTAPGGIDKPYIVDNRCAAAVTVQPSAGTGVSIPAGAVALVFSNAAGNTFWAAALAPSRSGAIFNLFGNRTDGAAPATTQSGLVTKGQVEDMLIGTTGLPPPTGNAGKFLGSIDGLTYGFYSALPDFAGNNGKFLGLLAGVPQWQTINTNSRVLLSEQTVSSPVASINFTDLGGSTYSKLEMEVHDLTFASGQGASLQFAVAGPTYRTSLYNGGVLTLTGSLSYSNVTDGVRLSAVAASDTRVSSIVQLLALNDAARRSMAIANSVTTGGLTQGAMGFGAQLTAEQHVALRLIPSSGNFTAGVVRLYGVK